MLWFVNCIHLTLKINGAIEVLIIKSNFFHILSLNLVRRELGDNQLEICVFLVSEIYTHYPGKTGST